VNKYWAARSCEPLAVNAKRLNLECSAVKGLINYRAHVARRQRRVTMKSISRIFAPADRSGERCYDIY
jgi:hypothetical protein